MESFFYSPLLLGALSGVFGALMSQLGLYSTVLQKAVISKEDALSSTPVQKKQQWMLFVCRFFLGIFCGTAVAFYLSNSGSTDSLKIIAFSAAAGYVGDSVETLKALAKKLGG